MNKEAATKLAAARAQLLLNKGEGFWGVLALRLDLVEDGSIPTLAVDGRHIFYNPEYVLSLEDTYVRSAIAHEVQHCVFQHMSRRGDRTPRRWNKAGDFAINLDLKDAGFDIHENWLLSNNYRGMSADEIYEMLPDDDEDGGPGDPQDAVLPANGNDAHDQEIEWKIATVQAAQANKNSTLPAHVKRLIEEATTTKVDWRSQLRMFINQVARDDYSFMRPNKRFLGAGFFLPSLYSESMGEIAVAIDTSGSITQDMLNTFGTEIKSIISSCAPSLTRVIYCDAEVNHVDEFTPYDDVKFELHGGGGTDFRPPFDHLRKIDAKPVCFIYLTDGYGPFPDQPEYPVLWVMTTDVVPPFGEHIRIEM